jgi:hypothetical protein
VQVAGFAVAGERALVAPGPGSDDGLPLRCASVLKPLLFWAAVDAFADREAWAAAARPAVVCSANAPAVQLWERLGGRELLSRLAARSGGSWPLEPGGARSFGRVLVTAPQVAGAYAQLALAARRGDEPAAQLLEWMRRVPERQTFGARRAAARALAVGEDGVAVKCGWFLDTDEAALRTHAVTVCESADGSLRGSAVLTAVEAPAGLHAAYAREYVHGDEVLHHHWELAGDAVVEGTRAALEAATRLQHR